MGRVKVLPHRCLFAYRPMNRSSPRLIPQRTDLGKLEFSFVKRIAQAIVHRGGHREDICSLYTISGTRLQRVTKEGT